MNITLAERVFRLTPEAEITQEQHRAFMRKAYAARLVMRASDRRPVLTALVDTSRLDARAIAGLLAASLVEDGKEWSKDAAAENAELFANLSGTDLVKLYRGIGWLLGTALASNITIAEEAIDRSTTTPSPSMQR